jgi:hypothetical protein
MSENLMLGRHVMRIRIPISSGDLKVWLTDDGHWKFDTSSVLPGRDKEILEHFADMRGERGGVVHKRG